MRTRPIGCLLVLLATLIVLGGCTRKRASFEGYDPAQVWTAMTVAAETPEYDDWLISANDVWVDQAENRIEIHRRLKRILHRPGYEPLPEIRTYRFQVSLLHDDPPTAKFISRGPEIPAYVWTERDRYFEDVRRLLGGQPMPAPMTNTEPATQPTMPPESTEEPEAAPDDDRPIDIDDLGGG